MYFSYHQFTQKISLMKVQLSRTKQSNGVISFILIKKSSWWHIYSH